MNLFRTVVGVDLSGMRMAAVAVRSAPGGASVAFPPLSHDLRGEQEAARLEEAESVLAGYVARHRLMGADVFLALPTGRVYMARTAFPPMREKDLREAVGLELDRLFPVPPDSLRYGYRRVPGPAEGGKVPLVVAAVSREYLDDCGQLLSRAGLSLAGAAPAGWAAGAALSRVEGGLPSRGGAHSALLRWLGDSVECAVFSGTEPLFCSSCRCAEEDARTEGVALALSGLTDAARESDEPVDLYAPAGWFSGREFRPDPESPPFRVVESFPANASSALFGPGTPANGGDPFPVLCAYGAAAAGDKMDILSSRRPGEMSRAMRTAVASCAAAALLLGTAWPAAVAWKAKSDLRELDSRVAALRPFAERHGKALAGIDEAEAKLSVLRGETAESAEPLRILMELTDRIPNGTWLTSLRVEGRSIDIEGLSPSASELFPPLTREGRFKSVDFGAPITRQGDNMERFKLRGEYVPPSVDPAAPAASPAAPDQPPAAGSAK